jgi:hypothetical protein
LMSQRRQKLKQQNHQQSRLHRATTEVDMHR